MAQFVIRSSIEVAVCLWELGRGRGKYPTLGFERDFTYRTKINQGPYGRLT